MTTSLKTSVRLPRSLVERLDGIAEAEGTTRTDVILETLEMAIDAREQVGPAKLPKLVLPE